MFGETLISIISIVTPFVFVAWIISTSRGRKDKKVHSDEELEQGIKELAKRIVVQETEKYLESAKGLLIGKISQLTP